MPAHAQDGDATVDQRIESVFTIVPGNPIDLAVPLTRRALARRSIENGDRPVVSAPPATESAASPAETVLAPSDSAASDSAPAASGTAAANVAPQPAANGAPQIESAAGGEVDAESTRLPRPRPGEEQEKQVAAAAVEAPETMGIGSPLDLVAGAALASEPFAVAAISTSNKVTTDAEPQPLAEFAGAESCLSPTKLTDADGDLVRNVADLSVSGMCINEMKFEEQQQSWDIQTIASGRAGPLWVVMHDDEDVAFDNAMHGLKLYGGTLIAVEADGNRNLGDIDPNRNFSADGIGCAKLGDSATPKFSGAFKALFDASQPIIALHNNADGPASKGRLGHISMQAVPRGMQAMPSADPSGALAGERNLVLIAATDPVDDAMKDRAAGLNAKGINVVLEPVQKDHGDCSLSNYSVLAGHKDYFYITVDHNDAEKQRKIIDTIMSSFFTVAASN